MKHHFELSQKGQSLITVAIFMVALLAMLALVMDGGNAYLKRRQAQNAADAGALAGARKYCSDPVNNYGIAIAAANEYVGRNDASTVSGYPTIIDNTVTVASTITYDTFFGSIINQPENTSRAIAAAGCFGPCLAEGVLPVVWTCNDSDIGPNPGNIPCDNLAIDDPTLDNYLYHPDTTPGCEFIPEATKAANPWMCPELTIVIDNIDVDVLACESTGGIIDCDLDDDGNDDYISSDNRGWADLDGNTDSNCSLDVSGTEGSVELSNWIEFGYECSFENHTWVGDQSGMPTSLLHTIETERVEKNKNIVLLPVFDWSCPYDPTGHAECHWHEGAGTHPPDDIIHELTSAPNYYHIIKFSAFYITCVQEKKGECPGASKFYKDNKSLFIGGGDPIDGADYNAVEGYFLRDYVPGLHGKCEFDPDGPFTIYLDR